MTQVITTTVYSSPAGCGVIPPAVFRLGGVERACRLGLVGGWSAVRGRGGVVQLLPGAGFVWVVEVAEQAGGFFPGVPLFLLVAGGLVGVAEGGEGFGLVVPVAERAEKGKGVLVAQDGGPGPAEPG